MTRREIVKAAIQHREADRIPYFIDFCGDAWEALQKAGVTGDRTIDEFVDNDVQDVGVPWWNWYELEADWGRPSVPASAAKVIGSGSYDKIADNIKALRDKSDKYFLVRIYGSHFEKAYFSRGFENFLGDMGGEPEFTRSLLNRIIDKNLVMLENFLSIKEIDGVLLGSDWGSQRGLLMAPAMWEDLIRPGEQKEYDLIHGYGKDVWVHSCGNIEAVIPSLIEIGLDVLNPIQPEAMDISELKTRYGNKLAFWGGLSTQQTLPFGTPVEVKKEAQRVIDLMGKGGGYIFSPAQSIQNDVPVANVMALLELARAARVSL
jgi:uroporphyrinogen decarboxylase